jgi:hypothetical protein
MAIAATFAAFWEIGKVLARSGELTTAAAVAPVSAVAAITLATEAAAAAFSPPPRDATSRSGMFDSMSHRASGRRPE